jgi:flagellar protein FliO/FliZ
MSSILQIVQVLAALAITLGLFGLGVWVMRRYGPNVVQKLQTVRGPRRLEVVETLMLDHGARGRRLVLVSIDGRERLILLGDGRFADAKPQETAP